MQQDIPRIDKPFRPFQRGENLAGLHGIYSQFGFLAKVKNARMPMVGAVANRAYGGWPASGLGTMSLRSRNAMQERRTGRRGCKPRLRGMACIRV